MKSFWTTHTTIKLISPYTVIKSSLISHTEIKAIWNTVTALVRWATGKRLTNRLPKLSLITLSLWTAGFLVFVWGPYVPTPKFFTISGDPGRVIYHVLDMRKFIFLEKTFSWWTWDSNSRPTTHGLSTKPFVKASVRWATGESLTNRLPKLSLITPPTTFKSISMFTLKTSDFAPRKKQVNSDHPHNNQTNSIPTLKSSQVRSPTLKSSQFGPPTKNLTQFPFLS